ncbi:MAG: NAD(P)-bd dom domain-containing protein [Bacteroidetes bacterium]|nr:NAD(P)-bd dom domain-containing protein [Bacteroidota bacterium]
MMVVCITGCLGFMGSQFTRACLKKGWQVWGIDKKTYSAREEYQKEFSQYNSFRFLEADIADLDHLYEVDYVFNFAAETHVDNSLVDSSRFLHSNIMGVKNLLELVRAKRNYEMPVFFQIGTDEVYGDLERGNHAETDPLKPSNPYSASKAAADMLVLGWHRSYEVPYNIVRATNNYGIGQYPEKLIPKAVKYLSLGKKIPLHGDGSYMRNWLHVEDMVNAVFQVVERGKRNTIYNISGGNEMSNKEVITRIVKCYFGKPVSIEEYVQFNYVRMGEDKRYSLDDSGLRKLGWRNTKIFDDELPLIVEHYKNRFTW